MLIIGHRGACGYRPEHTVASYALAAQLGADYLEPDLVVTADNHLIARHDVELSATTDIQHHPQFAHRRTTRVIDDRAVTGWFSDDFTLAEIKQLRATERLPHIRSANTAYNGKFSIPTFEEVLTLRAHASAELGREIGVYPELKHPSYFAQRGLSFTNPLARALSDAHLKGTDAPVLVQSFELGALLALRQTLPATRLIMLIAPGRGDTADLAEYAAAGVYGVGVAKDLLVEHRSDGTLGASTGFAERARTAGLVVHGWTFRAETAFLPTEFWAPNEANPASTAHCVAGAALGDLGGELRRYSQLGIDGVFTDHPDLARAALTDSAPANHLLANQHRTGEQSTTRARQKVSIS